MRGAWGSRFYITMPAVHMYRMVHVDRMDILLIILVKHFFCLFFLRLNRGGRMVIMVVKSHDFGAGKFFCLNAIFLYDFQFWQLQTVLAQYYKPLL